MHVLALHVENVAKEYVAVDVKEIEEVFQGEQPQEFEVADPTEGQVLETDFANPNSQQGKSRFILKPSVTTLSLSLLLLLLILVH